MNIQYRNATWKMFLCALLLMPAFASAQIKATAFNPDTTRIISMIKGEVVEAWTWNDKAGKNFLVLSETAEKKSKACEDCIEKELYAYHFVRTKLLWRIYDHVMECPFDIMMDFRKNSFRVTDLDKDGVGESWFMYNRACKSDVSPSGLKLMMHEGQNKYAIRGRSQHSREALDPNDQAYEPDAAFKKLSKAYQDFGAALWKKFLYDF